MFLPKTNTIGDTNALRRTEVKDKGCRNFQRKSILSRRIGNCFVVESHDSTCGRNILKFIIEKQTRDQACMECGKIY